MLSYGMHHHVGSNLSSFQLVMRDQKPDQSKLISSSTPTSPYHWLTHKWQWLAALRPSWNPCGWQQVNRHWAAMPNTCHASTAAAGSHELAKFSGYFPSNPANPSVSDSALSPAPQTISRRPNHGHSEEHSPRPPKNASTKPTKRSTPRRRGRARPDPQIDTGACCSSSELASRRRRLT